MKTIGFLGKDHIVKYNIVNAFTAHKSSYVQLMLTFYGNIIDIVLIYWNNKYIN